MVKISKKRLVRSFNELTKEEIQSAGGKGGILALLFQKKYPVPNGFVLMDQAFAENDELAPEAWEQVIEKWRKGTSYAVRSSALSEDSATASFAGEFETVLEITTEEELRTAIRTVRQSRLSDRVKAYSQAKGMEFRHEMAIVVQELVLAQISGVLFTADPVSGSRLTMTGNYVHGFGDKLVSGEADAHAFTLQRPKGEYNGPPELKQIAKKLYKYATQLEKELQSPQDIEWCSVGDDIFILQSRPITSLIARNPQTGEMNDSLHADFLWTSAGWGENLPGIVTPSTWSLWEIHFVDLQEWTIEFDYPAPAIGLIAGRPYMNLGFYFSIISKIRGKKRARKIFEPTFGIIPDVDFTIHPISWGSILFNLIPKERKWQKLVKETAKKIPEFNKSTPERCRSLRNQIKEINTKSELVAIWNDEVKPFFVEANLMIKTINEFWGTPSFKMQNELGELVGKADTDVLMSTMGGTSQQLASLGLMAGIEKIVNDEISKEEFLEQYGHRGEYEWHLSKPRLYEDPSILDEQIESFRKTPFDMESVFRNRPADYEDAWRRFEQKHPKKAKKYKEQLDKYTSISQQRETIRSEMTRVVGVVRDWFLRAGELTNLGNDVFFLSYQELLDVLSGQDEVTDFIPKRKETYKKYESLPPLPNIINGPFFPFEWINDPNRRLDIYDAHAPKEAPLESENMLSGNPGSGGQVEGTVRVIHDLEDGDQLQKGEIMVTYTTNVGWTPLFPRAAAVITDIGMPLAHAAIVAREIGIPAVVGCGKATTFLKTGDRVLVDGNQGTVEILERV